MSMRTFKETPVIQMQTMTAFSIPVRFVLINLPRIIGVGQKAVVGRVAVESKQSSLV